MIEIERRFLLKRFPKSLGGFASIYITQVYVEGGPRLRKSTYNDRVECVKCFKKRISDMSSEETEEVITSEQFYDLYRDATRVISKVRYKVPHGALIWEIDVISDPDLVIAEVELPSEETPVELPDFIKNELIIEITGMHQFSNFNLASAI